VSATSERPLSAYLRSGWDVAGFSSCLSEYGLIEHSFHLRRQNENKIVSIRRKMMGSGLEVRELDV